MGSPRHHEWFESVQRDIQAQYDELHAGAAKKSNIQRSGHGAETTWATVLDDWLPPGYEVGTRKYILPEAGNEEEAFETDLVVFNRGYPARLQDRHEVLAGGVAAAFSVKLTIDAAGIRDGVDRAARLRKALKPRDGTVRSELISPLAVGLLGHSHEWKRPHSKPFDAIDNALERESAQAVLAPRETLDLVCVSDVATWSLLRTVWPNGGDVSVNLAMMGSSRHHSPAPVGVFVGALVGRLARFDAALKPFAAGLAGTDTLGMGAGRVRTWNGTDVFSDEVSTILRNRVIPSGEEWQSTYWP